MSALRNFDEVEMLVTQARMLRDAIDRRRIQVGTSPVVTWCSRTLRFTSAPRGTARFYQELLEALEEEIDEVCRAHGVPTTDDDARPPRAVAKEPPSSAPAGLGVASGLVPHASDAAGSADAPRSDQTPRESSMDAPAGLPRLEPHASATAASSATPPSDQALEESSATASAGLPQLGSPAAITIGSVGHPILCSRPCRFVVRGECANGAKCGYCHFPHTSRSCHLSMHMRQLLRDLPSSALSASIIAALEDNIRKAELGSEAEDALRTWASELFGPGASHGRRLQGREHRNLQHSLVGLGFNRLCNMALGSSISDDENERVGRSESDPHTVRFLERLRSIWVSQQVGGTHSAAGTAA